MSAFVITCTLHCSRTNAHRRPHAHPTPPTSPRQSRTLVLNQPITPIINKATTTADKSLLLLFLQVCDGHPASDLSHISSDTELNRRLNVCLTPQIVRSRHLTPQQHTEHMLTLRARRIFCYPKGALDSHPQDIGPQSSSPT